MALGSLREVNGNLARRCPLFWLARRRATGYRARPGLRAASCLGSSAADFRRAGPGPSRPPSARYRPVGQPGASLILVLFARPLPDTGRITPHAAAPSFAQASAGAFDVRVTPFLSPSQNPKWIPSMEPRRRYSQMLLPTARCDLPRPPAGTAASRTRERLTPVERTAGHTVMDRPSSSTIAAIASRARGSARRGRSRPRPPTAAWPPPPVGAHTSLAGCPWRRGAGFHGLTADRDS